MKHFFLAACILAALSVWAQVDTSIFRDIKKVEVMEYVFTVPQTWKKIDQIDLTSNDRKFDFTMVGLPETYKNTPLTASFSLRKSKFDSLPPAVEFAINELTSYPDRITPAGHNYTRDSITLSSGETGVLISTDYYRRTKAQNYSCYEFVVYSKKRKAAYILNVTYQYRDTSYEIIKALKFREYALRIFNSLILR